MTDASIALEVPPRTIRARIRGFVWYFAPRLFGALVTLWLAVTFVFLLGSVLGDPVALMLGDAATEEQVDAMREELGLNRPLVVQYADYLGDLASGDLGTSIRYMRPNVDLIATRLPYTLMLAGAAVLIGIVVGVPLGIIAALRENTLVDRLAVTTALLTQSLPLFWLGLMLILLFSVELGWLPASGAGSFRHLILPAVTLSAYPIARIARLTRSSMAEALSDEYVAAARARGLPERRVVLVHALRNAALPVVTLIGIQAGVLLSGAVTVEFVFAWPGMGLLATTAVRARDISLVQAVVVVGATGFIVINLLLDALYGFIDPRIRDAA